MPQPRRPSVFAVAREQVAASGDSLEARLVYADLLTERGDPRGLFITAQCSGQKRAADELLARYRAHFLHPLPQDADVEFRDGLIHTWTTDGQGFRRAGRRLLRTVPLRRLIVNAPRVVDVAYIVTSTGFENVRIFELINPCVGAMQYLASIDSLPGLQTLGIIGNWTPSERQALLDSKLRTTLQTLEFTSMRWR